MVRRMRFDGVVDKLYEKYVRVVRKEEKIGKVRKKARELGFSEVSVEFNGKTKEARAMIEIENEKLKEVAEWLVTEEFYVYRMELIITTAKIEKGKVDERTLKRANEIGLEYIKYEQIDTDDYIDFFEIEGDEEKEIYVYLAIYNYES